MSALLSSAPAHHQETLFVSSNAGINPAPLLLILAQQELPALSLVKSSARAFASTMLYNANNQLNASEQKLSDALTVHAPTRLATAQPPRAVDLIKLYALTEAAEKTAAQLLLPQD
jgi:hypothetical protein